MAVAWGALHHGYLAFGDAVDAVTSSPMGMANSADLTLDEIEALPLPPGTERVVDGDGVLLGYRDSAAARTAGVAATVGAELEERNVHAPGGGAGGGGGSIGAASRSHVSLVAEHPLLRLAREDAERQPIPSGWQTHTTVLPDGSCRSFYTRYARSRSDDIDGGGGNGGDCGHGPSGIGVQSARTAYRASHVERDYLGCGDGNGLCSGALGGLGNVLGGWHEGNSMGRHGAAGIWLCHACRLPCEHSGRKAKEHP